MRDVDGRILMCVFLYKSVVGRNESEGYDHAHHREETPSQKG